MQEDADPQNLSWGSRQLFLEGAFEDPQGESEARKLVLKRDWGDRQQEGSGT